MLLCVFVGEALTRAVVPSAEGTPEWIPIAALDRVDLVDGRRLLPRLLETDRLLFGHQFYDAEGRIGAFTLG